MSRGRGGYSPRGSSYRGSRGSYSGDRYSSYSSPYDSRKYGSSDRFSSGSRDYRSSYRSESRESGHRSPDRKRMRTDGPPSHRDSYSSSYSSRYDSSYDKRSYGGDRHSSSSSFPTRREEFRRPAPPRGSYRGRPSSRGIRGGRLRERVPIRRRMIESSYPVRKRGIGRVEYGRRPKISRVRSVLTRRPRKRSSSPKEDSSDDEKEKKETKKEKKEKEPEDDDDNDKEEETKEPEEKKSPKKEKASSDKDSDNDDDRKNYIKLVCPHCNTKAPTFHVYMRHLSSRSHMMAMRKIAMKHKSILSQMRLAQRNKQNELEKTSEDLTSHTNFCPLCKLNYKQHKATHQATDAHKNMRKFLMPFCKICNISFKSPMSFESHCCSISHIKRKQRADNTSENSEAEDNLEDFTTIDSVGDNEAASDPDNKKEDKKEPVNVGIEQIKKVEAHYCDLCKMYLPRGEESELQKTLAKHCKLRVHMRRYVILKERQELEKKAEKLQRKENAAKEKNKESTEGDKDEEMKEDGNKSIEEDKLWADVDKDLGDILAEAESGAKSSDEDEDDSHVAGERYDRFKLSGDKKDEDSEDKKETKESKKEEEKK